MFQKEVELPGELVGVERDAVRKIAVGIDFGAAALQQLEERDRLAIQRRVFGERGRAQMRLQRDVAEVVLRQNPEGSECPSTRGTGSGICRSRSATFANGSDANSIGPG